VYKKPYIMHGSIGPSAGAANFDGCELKIWTQNQGIYPLQGAISDALEIECGRVVVQFVPGAGVYGHNGADDAAFDAAIIAMHLKNFSILLKWTREDEHCWEPYGSAMQCDLQASINKEGNITYWSHETFSDTFLTRPVIGKEPGSRLLSSHFVENLKPWPVTPPMLTAHGGIHRNMEHLYNLPSQRLVKHRVYGLPLRTSALRALGAFGNIFAIESMMDELAVLSGLNPFEFRLMHLSDTRAMETLKKLEIIIESCKTSFPNGSGLGISFSRYKNSAGYCSLAMLLNVNDDAEIELQKVFCVVDVGEVVDVAGVKSQVEGGIIQAASWSLYEQVTYEATGITSRDWDSYPIISFNNIPEINIEIIDRPGSPYLGVGEIAAGPTGASIANAINDAIGLRLREMPFNSEAIKSAALSN
ncbi:MAG: molybdopterin cofactor-binding domain-containing protein, partial [Pseudomonadota bacterium]|nr:molybdopterin cofactor-binding domain-containing protein [Pseudomonadota bacterium]